MLHKLSFIERNGNIYYRWAEVVEACKYAKSSATYLWDLIKLKPNVRHVKHGNGGQKYVNAATVHALQAHRGKHDADLLKRLQQRDTNTQQLAQEQPATQPVQKELAPMVPVQETVALGPNSFAVATVEQTDQNTALHVLRVQKAQLQLQLAAIEQSIALIEKLNQ